jgi:hypothetical protein
MRKLLIVTGAVILTSLFMATPAQARTPAECQSLLGLPGLSGPAAPGSYEKCLAMPEDTAVPGIFPNPANLQACLAAKQLGGDVHGMC